MKPELIKIEWWSKFYGIYKHWVLLSVVMTAGAVLWRLLFSLIENGNVGSVMTIGTFGFAAVLFPIMLMFNGFVMLWAKGRYLSLKTAELENKKQ